MSRRTLMLAIVCFSWVALAAAAAYNLDDPNLRMGSSTDLEIQSFSTTSRESLASASGARAGKDAQLAETSEAVDRLNADLAGAKPR